MKISKYLGYVATALAGVVIGGELYKRLYGNNKTEDVTDFFQGAEFSNGVTDSDGYSEYESTDEEDLYEDDEYEDEYEEDEEEYDSLDVDSSNFENIIQLEKALNGDDEDEEYLYGDEYEEEFEDFENIGEEDGKNDSEESEDKEFEDTLNEDDSKQYADVDKKFSFMSEDFQVR